MQAKVKIFSTPTCHYCELAKGWMIERGIKFQEVNVSGNAEALDFIVEKTGRRSVPVTELPDGRILVGFNGYQFSEAFGIRE